MTLESFGYNGLFELNEDIVNRLLATQAYENNLVLMNGQPKDDDLLDPIVLAQADGSTIRIYLLTGRPTVSFQGHDGTNLVTLFVPMFGMGVFYSDGNGSHPIDVGLPGKRLGIAISDIGIKQGAGALTLDFSGVTANSIVIRLFTFVEPFTHVGGTAIGALDLTDSFIDSQFSASGLPLTGKDLRTEIAKAVTGAKLKQNIVRINPGGIQAELGMWDLMTFDQTSGGIAGAVLELYGPGNQGQGSRTFGLDVIPGAEAPPLYHWTAVLREDVLQEIFSVYFDRTMYPRQGSTLNTSSNEYGYMVVPPAGVSWYSLPSHSNTVSVSTPAAGKVNVEVSKGFAAHTRARLQVLGTTREESVTADGDGSVSVSIKANTGDRLAFIVDATSMPTEPSVVIWRPKITFQNGTIRLDFHFYKYLDISCDAEGDGFMVLELYADRTAAFQLGLRLTDSHFDIPYWVYAAAWFGGNMLSVLGGALSLVLVETVGENMIRDNVNPQKQADSLLGELKAQLPAPQAPDSALFLDDLITSEEGFVLAGRADAGRIVSYGRKSTSSNTGGVVLQGNGFYAAFDWDPSFGAITMRPRHNAKALSDNPAEVFWSSTYDDFPYPPYPLAADSAVINAGGSVLFFVDAGEMLAKVLVERSILTGIGIIVTWVAYQKRVVQGVKIRNHVKAIVVGGSDSLVLSLRYYKYDGVLSLDPTKFFLNDDTQQSGLEHWYWDGIEVSEAGLSVPGGVVSVNASTHELYVQYDQTQLLPGDSDVSTHWVTFTGTDVFGRTLTTKYLLDTPSSTLTPKRIAEIPGFRDPRGPIIDPIRERIAAARAVLAMTTAAYPGMESAANTILTALKDGTAALDANQAQAVLNLMELLGR